MKTELIVVFCFQCGKKIRDGAKFCPYCGARTEEPQAAVPPQPQEPAVQKEPAPPRQETVLIPPQPEAAKPAAPVQTDAAAQPTVRTEPAAPAEPEQTAEPTVLIEPAAPAEPAAPVQPVIPAQPVAPAQPVVPARPAAPIQPPVPPVPQPARNGKIPPRVPQQPVPVQKKKNLWLPLVIVLVVLAILCGTGVYVWQSGLLDDMGELVSAIAESRADKDAEEEAPEDEEEPDGKLEAQEPAEEQPPAEEPEEETPPEEPAVKEEIPEHQQEILVECTGSSAVLTLKEWQEGSWVDVMTANARIGANGITENKQEGDRKTPAGTYNLLFAFSTEPLSTDLTQIQVHSGDVWVCDSDSDFYNTLQSSSVSGKDWTSSENMYDKFSKNRSVACICFDFNGDGRTAGSAVADGGSALFLDGVGSAGKIDSGYGDIKIAGADMTALLSYLDAAKRPVITIR